MPSQPPRRRALLRAAAAATAGVGALAVGARTGLLSGDSPDDDFAGLPRLQLSADGDSDVAALEVPLGDDLLPRVGRARWRSARLPTTTHSMVGFVWPRDAAAPELQVSSRRGDTWSPWRTVPVMHDLPDEDTQEWADARAGSQLLWIGPADGIRIKAAGHRPTGLTLVLLHPKRRAGDDLARAPLARTDAATPSGVVPRPPMAGRKAWGADETWRNGGPRYNPTIEQVHVHHTANSNAYNAEDVPALLRGIYRYHTQSLGWSDIAYNFLVDRFGRLWVGRAGGAAKPVRGAHTLGFNGTSCGVAVIGNFQALVPAPEVLATIERLAAWKLSLYGRDPMAMVAVVSEGSDKFAPRSVPVLPVIDGHRDTNDTECPGQLLYDRLPEIRTATQQIIQAAQVPPITITSPFTLTGKALVGSTMTVAPGVYTPADATVTYTWMRNGVATGDDPTQPTRVVAPEDLGQQISVAVALQRDGYTGTGATVGPSNVVTTKAVVSVRAWPRRGRVRVIVTVTAPGVVGPLPGEVRMRIDQRRHKVRPVGTGTVVGRFLGLGKGDHVLKVRYKGDGLVRSTRVQQTLHVKN